jgi:hypothetical protein
MAGEPGMTIPCLLTPMVTELSETEGLPTACVVVQSSLMMVPSYRDRKSPAFAAGTTHDAQSSANTMNRRKVILLTNLDGQYPVRLHRQFRKRTK